MVAQEQELERKKQLAEYKNRLDIEKAKNLAEIQIAQKEKEAGGKPLNAPQVLKVNEGNAIPSTLRKVARTIDDNKEIFGPIEGRLRSWNPYDVQARGIDAEMRAASQQFGRYMEGGVLRKEDEEKYRRMFPALTDPESVAKEKLRVVSDLLERKQKQDLTALKDQGYNLEGLDPFGLLTKDNRKEMVAEPKPRSEPNWLERMLSTREAPAEKPVYKGTIRIPKRDVEAIRQAEEDGYKVEVY